MSEVVVQAFITLDGVIQGPGDPAEDTEGGFDLGGWQSGYDISELVRRWEGKTEALLLGRKTYDIWSRSWGVWDENVDGLLGELNRTYNRVTKHVASRTRSDFEWKNTRLLEPDVPTAVARLREAPGGEIRVWGSSELIRTLAQHDLVDEYRLVTYPLVLGRGKKLFPDGFPASTFKLVESDALPSGVVVSVYRRA